MRRRYRVRPARVLNAVLGSKDGVSGGTIARSVAAGAGRRRRKAQRGGALAAWMGWGSGWCRRPSQSSIFRVLLPLPCPCLPLQPDEHQRGGCARPGGCRWAGGLDRGAAVTSGALPTPPLPHSLLLGSAPSAPRPAAAVSSVYSLVPSPARGACGEFWGVERCPELGDAYLAPFVLQVGSSKQGVLWGVPVSVTCSVTLHAHHRPSLPCCAPAHPQFCNCCVVHRSNYLLGYDGAGTTEGGLSGAPTLQYQEAIAAPGWLAAKAIQVLEPGHGNACAALSAAHVACNALPLALAVHCRLTTLVTLPPVHPCSWRR